jgi:hypothetical protein
MEEILVYGASWCLDRRRAKEFLADQRVSNGWHDIEREPDGVRVVQDRTTARTSSPRSSCRTDPSLRAHQRGAGPEAEERIRPS